MEEDAAVTGCCEDDANMCVMGRYASSVAKNVYEEDVCNGSSTYFHHLIKSFFVLVLTVIPTVHSQPIRWAVLWKMMRM
jgi:hypothetical protein